MATFNIGDSFAPRLSTSSKVAKTVNPESANISNYEPDSFYLPGPLKLQIEAQQKLSSSGQITDFKSLSVGSNTIVTPKTTRPAASQLPMASTEDQTNQLKVTIKQEPAVGSDINTLVFNVMPRIEEQGSAEYDPISPIHHPGVIQKFRSSSARSWTVSGQLISRTSEEASTNLKIINMIRSWRMPFFGEGTNNSSQKDKLGAPPPILTLSAYGSSMVGPVKCVLMSYSWSFPNDLDYIPTLEGNPFPVILDISLSLTESWSPAEFSGFDIVKYKAGDLSSTGAFSKISAPLPSSTQSAGSTVDSSEPSVAQGSSFGPVA